ncbi:Poly-beta-hydroxybutyrate polymerase [Caballeronia hypogeia]|uniref:Poly-beta-hydroxybutyrate polymerase n=1 Tax=Caballeronia hypogeia TaxID=1777140 RepID=A0A158CU86_9BURK|nr:alpha/beta fold hydrolase [Caballeronia hypogeia]SAK85915.1 Poly-beta-hydroxybutyrate polymerase [Caballeronia hypogeia]
MTTPTSLEASRDAADANAFAGLRMSDVLNAAQQFTTQALKQPVLFAGQEMNLMRDLTSICLGLANTEPQPGDRRFSDPSWRGNALYRSTMQGYLAWCDALSSFVDRSTLDAPEKARVQYVVSLLTDALAPTNALAGNPAALKKLVDTGGASLVAGLKNLAGDIASNRGMPTQVDKRAFEVGGNVANTRGSVVFRNEVLELIQYAPTTAKVYERPHLIVPPQINKFYVFDLAKGKSIVDYLLQGGFQAFVVSWRNPGAEQRDWDLDTYVRALIEAIDAVRDITGSDDVNLHGACSGAMTIAALLGHTAARGQKLVHAATLAVALLEGSPDSQLGLFATPEVVAAAKQNSMSKGVLPGDEMGRMFAWLRPNELVWNYWVNNYLLGNDPPAFDILYWNNDTTRLPGRMHGQLLDIFTHNLFGKKDALTVLGTPVDLAQVTCDKYVIGGMTDHITPWKGVYDTARMFGGKTRFVLSSSGHIQSLVNPPGNPKAKYFLNPALPATADDWLASAASRAGSWWEDWRDWLARRSGVKRVAPVAPGSERHPPIADAPGTYVLEA